MQETQILSLGQEDSLETGMATHSNILVWRIPWTENPGRLYSTWGCKYTFVLHKFIDLCTLMLYIFSESFSFSYHTSIKFFIIISYCCICDIKVKIIYLLCYPIHIVSFVCWNSLNMWWSEQMKTQMVKRVKVLCTLTREIRFPWIFVHYFPGTIKLKC